MGLNYQQIKELHYYYNECNSLQQTAEYCTKHYEELNRHQLSRLFRSYDLYVKPPNGRPEVFWRDLRLYNSPESHLCAAIIDGVFGDITVAGTDFLDHLTACAFVGTELWVLMLGTVINASEEIKIDPHTIMPDVDLNEVLRMRELYDEAYDYWVENTGD